jgi:aspartate/methionine/tyrosine aminotransferase
MDIERLISRGSAAVEISGIRKVFELARSLKNPINLSIGQPHFDTPEPIKKAAMDAIAGGKNAYTLTQGAPELRDRLVADVTAKYHHADRDVIVTSGTSGGLMLAMLAMLNPGDEVVTPDPYFVMYPNMVTLCGGTLVPVDTFPDRFRLDPERVMAACTARTKILLLCSPANPTGCLIEPDAMKTLAEFAEKRNILLVSDEIYSAFQYDGPARSPAEFGESVLVCEGFGKTYSMTGWRMGYAHGPARLIEEMKKLQQSTFICAPSMAQFGGLAALDFDMTGHIADYKRKRDWLTRELAGLYEFTPPGGAFYCFPKAPWGTGSEFVAEAIRNNLLIIPSTTFSQQDTHFRISYAAADDTLARGIEVLKRIVRR